MTVIGGFQPAEAGYSVNQRAADICGPRIPEGKLVIPIDQPVELGYHCPVCEYDSIVDGEFDDRLDWSEYDFFLWCSVCNVDYPSALCATKDNYRTPTLEKFTSDVEAQIHVFLDCMAQIKNSNKD